MKANVIPSKHSSSHKLDSWFTLLFYLIAMLILIWLANHAQE